MAEVRICCGKNISTRVSIISGFASRTADPVLHVHRESEVRISTRVVDGRADGPQSALMQMLSSFETMLAIERSGSMSVGEDVRSMCGHL